MSNVAVMSGAERVLLGFLRANSDIEPIVWAKQGEFLDSCRRAGFKARRSYSLTELRRNQNPAWPLELLLRCLICLFELAWVVAKERPKIIHANNFAAVIPIFLPSKLLGLPIVWHLHDIFRPKSIEGAACQVIGNRVDSVVAVSEAVKRSLLDAGVRSDRIAVIYNGLDVEEEFNPERYTAGYLRKLYDLPDDVLLVGNICQIVERKGVHVFIEGVNLLRPEAKRVSRFFVVGKSPSRQSDYESGLMRRVVEYSLQGVINFTGHLPNVAEVLRDLDIVVHSSISPDPLPTVVLEAMAMGKLVIAARSGGVPEIIRDGENGFLFEPGNASDLAEKMEFALNNCGRLQSVRLEARRCLSSRFTEGARREAMRSVYKSMLNHRGHAWP